MKLYTISGRVASAYGESTYGNCAYNENDPSCTSVGGGQAGGTGNTESTLADTGIALIVVVTLACVIAAAAIIVKAARRKKPITEATK